MGMDSRNVVVDILRIVFAFIIVLHHVWDTQEICGYLAVDFFFIVSGYMIIRSCRKNQEEGRERGTINYVLHKYLSFLPFLVVAEIFAGTVNAAINYAKNESIPKAINAAWYNLQNISCLSMADFFNGDVTWYLSALLISTLILYPIGKRSRVYFPRYIAPALGIVLLVVILVNDHTLSAPQRIMFDFVKKGLLRAIADMSLGIFAYECARWLSKLKMNNIGAVFCVIEIGCYLASIIAIFATKPYKINEIGGLLIVMLMFVGLTISFSNVSLTHEWTQKSEWLCGHAAMLATGSLMIYLNHTYLIDFWNKWGGGNDGKMFFILTFAIIMSVACYHAGKYLRKVMNESVKGLSF